MIDIGFTVISALVTMLAFFIGLGVVMMIGVVFLVVLSLPFIVLGNLMPPSRGKAASRVSRWEQTLQRQVAARREEAATRKAEVIRAIARQSGKN